MPNFSSVGTALAKECNMEPEEERESEEEGEDLVFGELARADLIQFATACFSNASRVLSSFRH